MQDQSSIWFAGLVSCPVPHGPTCMTFAPNADSAGFAFSKEAASPPQNTVSVPLSAASWPSTTGVSRRPIPRFAQIASSSRAVCGEVELETQITERSEDTRLNSSHQIISYAVFCLKKKKTRSRRNANIAQQI